MPVSIPGIHNHPLYWANIQGKGYAMCKVCNEKVGAKTGGYLVLKCRACVPNNWGWGGFDMCTNCYRKHASKVTGSSADGGASSAGLLVGDKGPKPPTQF